MVWEALNAETLEYPAESSVETQDSYDAVITSRKETEVLSPFPKDERNDWVTMDRDLLLFSIVERRWRAKLWRLFEGERERCEFDVQGVSYGVSAVGGCGSAGYGGAAFQWLSIPKT